METLGPFRLEHPLGRGGMGEVWRAVHERQGVPAAIKLLASGDRHALREEVRAVARLDHPGVILVYDHGIAPGGLATVPEGTPWFAMELCSGGSLASHPPAAWRPARAVLETVLEALACAHARGVLHRDLKPDNVLRSTEADVRAGWKLTDFGLAYATKPEGAVVGTPAYMAPEQFRDAWREYGPWTDLYALGCLAWELVTGEPPFGRARSPEAFALAHAEAPPPRFVPRLPVPPGFEDWLRRLLEKEPDRRPQAAADALAALRALEDPRHPARALLPETADAGGPPRAPMRLVGTGLGLFALRPVPLVDREQERNRLWSTLLQVAREGMARAVVLAGGFGVGKTRLVDWLAERAHEAGGLPVVRVTHSPQEGPEDGIGPALAAAIGADRQNPLATRAHAERWLRRRGVTDPWEWNAVAALLSPPPPDASGVVQLTTPAQRHAVARRLLERLAATRPVVLVIEDAQWGPDAVELARALLDAQALSPAAILVLLAVRHDAGAPPPGAEAALALGARPDALRLDVRPLTAPHLVQLVEGILGVSGALAARVRERAGGNPGFAVRLIGDWVERGLLLPDERGFQLRPGADVSLPDGLVAVGRERVERFCAGWGPRADDVRRALQLAAVLGTEVRRDEWLGACQAAAVSTPPELVARLVDAAFAEPREEGAWAFVDPVVHSAILAAIPPQARAGVHLACAAALRALPAVEGRAERLGRQLLAAGRKVEAADPLLDAARERLRRGEHDVALALLDERETGMREALLPPHDERWGQGDVLRARILTRLGRFQDALPPAERALAGARRFRLLGLLPSALAVRGEVARGRGEPAAAIELLNEARDTYEAARDDAGLAEVLRTLGLLYRQLGDLTIAQRLLQQAQLLRMRARDPVGVADCLVARADCARRARHFDAVTDLLAQAEAAYARRHHRPGEAEVRLVRGDLARVRGDLDGAIEHYRAALELQEAIGSHEVLAPLAGLAMALDLRERAVDARKVLTLALELAEAQGSHAWRGVVHALALPVEAGAGDVEALDRHLAEARRWLDRTGEVSVDVVEAAERAARRIELKDPLRAGSIFRLAREHASRFGGSR